MSLPNQYAWLDKEPGPRVLHEALALYGTEEKSGEENNPVILGWAKECGISYAGDSVPWCGLLMAVVVKRAGYSPVATPLWAQSWSKWGNAASTPSLGDVLVFIRPSGGHVGLYVGEDATTFHVLGGNQSDSVRISRIAKGRLIAARRSPWKIGQPKNVRRVILSDDGELSTNES